MALVEAPAATVVAAKVEPVLLQGLLDLLDRLLAEVRDRSELVLRLHDEIADRLDADALEAVVRADAELELLDREVLHPVRESRPFPERFAISSSGFRSSSSAGASMSPAVTVPEPFFAMCT